MAIFVVQTLDDEDDGTTDPNDADLSLREAVRLAVSSPFTEDTISFREDLAGGTVKLTQGPININFSTRDRQFPLTIDGNINGDHLPDITIDAQGESRVIEIIPVQAPTSSSFRGLGPPVTLDGLVITGGKASRDAGISVVDTPFSLVGSVVKNNESENLGGGIGLNNVFGGPVVTNTVITDTTISENTAGTGGGGIAFRRNFVTVVNTTINSNTAEAGGGGGIFGHDARPLVLVNSTVSGNAAFGDNVFGGGVLLVGLVGDSSITLQSSTISGNVVTGVEAGGGGISRFDTDRGALILHNSIVAGNVAGDVVDDVFGTIGKSNGANILSEANVDGAVAGDQQGVDPARVFDQTAKVGTSGVLAGVLADNGGPTQTIALNPNGVAVDAGRDVTLEAPGPDRDFERPGEPTDDVVLQFDQRGPDFVRVVDLPNVGSTIDVGAFEVQGLPLPPDLFTPDADARNLNNFDLTQFANSTDALAGNDTVILSETQNIGRIFQAGAGNDVIRGSTRGDVIRGGDGNDNLLGRGGRDDLFGADGADTLLGEGAADLLRGGRGADRLAGGGGDDTVRGGEGPDVLNGGTGADRLVGGGGDDTVRGGEGQDVLKGGTGDDTFDFNSIEDSSPDDRDRIDGFYRIGAAAGDEIDLASIDANVSARGNNTFDFIGTAEFSSRGQVRVFDQRGDTVIAGNSMGNRAADFEVVVDDGDIAAQAWRAADFVL